MGRRTISVQRVRAGGFTLLELMVALSVLGILAAIGAANFGSIINATRVRAAALDLSSDMAFARAEAIKRNDNVTLARTGGEWVGGWQITASGGAVTLRTRDALAATLSSSSTASTFVFEGSGRVTANGNVTICPPASAGIQGRRITLDTLGLPRSDKLTCS